MQLEEAFQILYRGQSNVAHVAAAVDLPLGKMKSLFREYVSRNPLDEQAWLNDIVMTWPYA
jgi:hypothetical protein